MRKLAILIVIIALLISTAATVYAAPPPDGPPGLERAIAAQEAHSPKLLRTTGVVGTAIGLTADGKHTIRIFTESAEIAGLPRFLNGVPVTVEVTGKFTAVKGRPAGKGPKNRPPAVTIISPVNGAVFTSGDSIFFEGTAADKEDGDLTSDLSWTSSIDGSIGSGGLFDEVLSDGIHTITAKVNDYGSKTGEDSVVITIGSGATEEPVTTDWWPRPVAIGTSTGNANDISAGTIACRVRDAQGNLYALSNTHVYAPNNLDSLGAIGDTVSQPGVYDIPGYIYSEDYYLGQLTNYVPIDGSILGLLYDINFVDAAIAKTDLLGNSTPSWGYGMPKKTTKNAVLGMPVKKFGRTSELTEGVITGINAKIIIGYGNDWYAAFSKQIIIESDSSFIQPGDSGSLLVSDSNNPVGLLFAGDDTGQMAFANEIDRVLRAFRVTIDGE